MRKRDWDLNLIWLILHNCKVSKILKNLLAVVSQDNGKPISGEEVWHAQLCEHHCSLQRIASAACMQLRMIITIDCLAVICHGLLHSSPPWIKDIDLWTWWVDPGVGAEHDFMACLIIWEWHLLMQWHSSKWRSKFANRKTCMLIILSDSVTRRLCQQSNSHCHRLLFIDKIYSLWGELQILLKQPDLWQQVQVYRPYNSNWDALQWRSSINHQRRIGIQDVYALLWYNWETWHNVCIGLASLVSVREENESSISQDPSQGPWTGLEFIAHDILLFLFKRDVLNML